MNNETKAALEKSITKWQAIVDGTGVDEGAENCALCLMFYAKACRGCPVSERSREAFCAGTPYAAWSRATRDDPNDEWGVNGDPERIRLAQAELDFLISLREA